MYSEDTSSATTSTDHFTMATQERVRRRAWGKVCKGIRLERRLIKQGSVHRTAWSSDFLLCAGRTLSRFTRFRVGVWLVDTKGTSPCVLTEMRERRQPFHALFIHAVSAGQTDSVAKHHLETPPTSHPWCHGGITRVRDESAVSNSPEILITGTSNHQAEQTPA